MDLNLIFTVLAFSIIFDLGFTMIAERSPKFKKALGIIPVKMKGKFFYKWIISLPFIILIGLVSLLLGANQWIFGVLIGFGIALFDILFRPEGAESILNIKDKENSKTKNNDKQINKSNNSSKKKKKKKK